MNSRAFSSDVGMVIEFMNSRAFSSDVGMVIVWSGSLLTVALVQQGSFMRITLPFPVIDMLEMPQRDSVHAEPAAGEPVYTSSTASGFRHVSGAPLVVA